MGKAEIWNVSTSLLLNISQVSEWFSTSCRRKIVKMVNLRKEIENEKWNKKKLGPCMNVSLDFDPYSNTTFDLFHPKQWLQKRSNIKEIETWKVANRLWNGKMIKKWPMLKANSVEKKWLNYKAKLLIFRKRAYNWSKVSFSCSVWEECRPPGKNCVKGSGQIVTQFVMFGCVTGATFPH